MTSPASASGRQANDASETRLDHWVAEHGPLSPPVAVTLALRLCSDAARRSDAQGAQAWASMDVAHVWRGDDGSWEWRPAPDLSARRRPREGDVLERIGLVMFHALAGVAPPYRAADAEALQSHLRAARPDLPASFVQIVGRALTANDQPGAGLDAFAREIRQWLGVEPARAARARWKRWIVVAAAGLAMGVAAWLATVRPAGEAARSSGLSAQDLATADGAMEYADYLAITDEHTAALMLYQRMQRLWHAHVPPTDPRMIRLVTYEAWVRALTRDDLTTSQLLADKPESWTAQLGADHPYTRAAGLALADALSRTGETARAADVRREADESARQLLLDAPLFERLMPGVPTAPGVVAHVAPNEPEREGFRAMTGRSWGVPLTSTQRWLARESGWRLHVRAAAACEVSVDIGVDVRRVTVAMNRGEGGAWNVRVNGIELPAPAGTARDSLGVSLGADGGRPLSITFGSGITVTPAIDANLTRASEPFALRYEEDAGGCEAVWLEIGYPPQARLPPLPWPAEPGA